MPKKRSKTNSDFYYFLKVCFINFREMGMEGEGREKERENIYVREKY